MMSDDARPFSQAELAEDDDHVTPEAAAPADDGVPHAPPGPRTIELVSVGAAPRLDRYLTALHPEYSRSYIQGLIEEGRVTVDGRPAVAREKVKAGMRLRIDVPAPEDPTPQPEDIPLDILYEDADLLVVNKRPGMATHPSAGHPTGTLVNALLAHCGGSLSGINGVRRPGIIHRLDLETSGALVVARNDHAHRTLSDALRRRDVRREYLALVQGEMREDEGRIDTYLGRSPHDRLKRAVVSASASDARLAATRWRVRKRYHGATLLECQLETGRTHQVRVHLQSIGHPVVGDALYGYRAEVILAKVGMEAFQHIKPAVGRVRRQVLHAWRLSFPHPTTGTDMSFEAPLPDDLQQVLHIFDRWATS